MEGAGESGGCQEDGVLKEDGEEGDCWGTGDQSDPSDILRLGDSGEKSVRKSIDAILFATVRQNTLHYKRGKFPTLKIIGRGTGYRPVPNRGGGER